MIPQEFTNLTNLYTRAQEELQKRSVTIQPTKKINPRTERDITSRMYQELAKLASKKVGELTEDQLNTLKEYYPKIETAFKTGNYLVPDIFTNNLTILYNQAMSPVQVPPQPPVTKPIIIKDLNLQSSSGDAGELYRNLQDFSPIWINNGLSRLQKSFLEKILKEINTLEKYLATGQYGIRGTSNRVEESMTTLPADFVNFRKMVEAEIKRR